MENKNPNDSLSIFSRIDKDAKGSFITILILSIIKNKKKIWGYQIKKELQYYLDQKIKDSTLYTILNNLEKNYKLLTSYNEERRRYFELSKFGESNFEGIVNYWTEFAEKSIDILKKVN